jgi:dihydrofolate reductase
MRTVKYQVAMSLDGYIAAPDGGFDWIIHDPTIDFAAFFKTFDTALLGRQTYELARTMGPKAGMPGKDVYVISRTLRPEDHPDVTVVADAEATVSALRAKDGKDIWLMGGGDLFRSLLGAGLVDAVEVAVVPVLLGGGIPLLPPGGKSARLKLTDTHRYPSGIVSLSYQVDRTP